MNIVFLIIMSFWPLFDTTPEVSDVRIWAIDSGSVIEIGGSTNISGFRCESKKYQGGDVLTETYFPARDRSEWSGEITLETVNFDCFNALMTKDFRETLQIEQHPTIGVRFLKMTRESENINQENLRGEVQITLAGVSKIYPISCVFLAKNGRKALLTGERKLAFTDFEIEPPVKLLGTIKVKNSIEVSFGLILEEQL